jgi:membrane protein
MQLTMRAMPAAPLMIDNDVRNLSGDRIGHGPLDRRGQPPPLLLSALLPSPARHVWPALQRYGEHSLPNCRRARAMTLETVQQRATQTGNAVRVPGTNELRFGTFVRRTLHSAQRSHLSAFAGNLAFRTLFACFPCLFTVFWLLEAVGGSRATQSAVRLASTALPKAAAQAVQQQFSGVTGDQARGALTAGVVLAALVAVWAITDAVGAAMEALTAMAEQRERRPVWQRYLTALLLGLGLAALLLGALVIAVFGSAIAYHLGQVTGTGPLLRWAWAIASWPTLVLAVLAACTLLYTFAPAERRSWRWVTTGSLLATLLWLLFTVAFAVYVNHFSAPTHTYGALAGVAVLMLYLYGTAVALLLGAEMNRVIDAHTDQPSAAAAGVRTSSDDEGASSRDDRFERRSGG